MSLKQLGIKHVRDLSTIFDEILPYPVNERKEPSYKKQKSKNSIPPIITSELWIKHQTLKEQQKIEIENLKQLKKEERVNKKEQKKGENKKKRSNVVERTPSPQSPVPGPIEKIRNTGARGLCYDCGKSISIHQFHVDCMICKKRFHEDCVEENLEDQEDQSDIVFVCPRCMMNFSDDSD